MGGLKMEQQEKFDAMMRIAEFSNKNFYARRQYEWKITIAFWALIVGMIGLVINDEAPMLNRDVLTLVAPVVVVFFMFAWLRSTWVANENDKSIADKFLFDAEAVLQNASHTSSGISPKVCGLRKWFGFLGDWSRVFQAVTTALLAVALWFVAK